MERASEGPVATLRATDGEAGEASISRTVPAGRLRKLRGRRVRLETRLRSEDSDAAVRMSMIVLDARNRTLASDNMDDRPLRGAFGWTPASGAGRRRLIHSMTGVESSPSRSRRSRPTSARHDEPAPRHARDLYGRPPIFPDGPLNIPITPAAPLHPGATSGYAREGHRPWTALEQALGTLQGGHAVIFSSGMAAATAVMGLFPSA